MPTKLEMEGKVRVKTPVAWIVWEPNRENVDETNPPQLSKGVTSAGMHEVLINRRVDGVLRDRWEPERFLRHWMPFIPEPVYQPEDLELFRGGQDYRVLNRRQMEEYPKPPPTPFIPRRQ